MSVRQAVDRALRSGRVVVPDEFQAIYTEATASLDITQIHSGEYLFRGDDAAALARARFRNDAERREFFLGLLHQARERVMTQIAEALNTVPAAEIAMRLSCHSETRSASATSTTGTAACFTMRDATLVLRGGVCTASEPASCFVDPVLGFFGALLPASAFIGIPEATHPGDLAAIQLLDGVMFTRENFQTSDLPRETQISANMLRALYRANLCAEGSSLPDCS